MNEPIIELRGLVKRYGSLTAVDKLDLSIYKGEIFGLLGPNGAGKSTTILMMLGLTEPTAGSVRVCGVDSTRNPVEVKRKAGYLPDEVGFYDHRTGLENILYTAQLNSIPFHEAKERALQLFRRVGLQGSEHKKTGTYSRGMRQRLGLADVLIKNPEVIILDEPTLGIDPAGVREFLDLIVQLSREEKITVLLSSHHLHQVQKVCDRVGIFVSGKLLAEGDIPTLSQKLFNTGAFTVEAGISPQERNTALLENALHRIDGVRSITQGDNKLRIDCLRDVTADIAKTIVDAGFGLVHLSRKEYGLDDIYNRYFEGDKAYGQTA
jgi:ABC-2 type transport system ATP-binding protein